MLLEDKSSRNFEAKTKINAYLSERVQRLEVKYEFYKQIEFQRLLFFNIAFSVFMIAINKVLLKNTLFNNQSKNFNLIVEVIGLGIANNNIGLSFTSFVFVSLLALFLNKIYLASINKR